MEPMKDTSREAELSTRDRDNLRLLFEIGLMASTEKKPLSAKSIFRSLQLIAPEVEEPVIGLAFSLAMSGRFDEGLELFDEYAKKKGRLSDLGIAFQALIFLLQQRLGEAERSLYGIQHSEDPLARQLANSLLTTLREKY